MHITIRPFQMLALIKYFQYMQYMHKTYSTVTSSSITQSTKDTSVAILSGAFYLVTIKMIIECGSVICVICRLVIL